MSKYQYIGNDETFCLENPELNNYLYFPLANEAGVMSSITPDLAGDSKTSQNTFLLSPVSSDNLHNDKSSRNIWCKVNQREIWSLTGRSSAQQAELFTDKKDKTKVEAGFMHHKITRLSKELGLQAEITSFVPCTKEKVELMKVVLENNKDEPISLQVVAAIPIYGRSATNIRDHRHVTALLHRIKTLESGVIVNPTMTFDERGHQKNNVLYGIFGGNKDEKPEGFYPILEDFIGEGGNLENPKALYANPLNPMKANNHFGGYEAMGGICFQEHKLKPNEKLTYIIAMEYGNSVEELEVLAQHFLNENKFNESFEVTKEYWKKKVNVSYHTGSDEFDKWMRWVSFQPMLRRIYGCSFLPHHDYGKGGRGWRDLWQDCLALLIMNPDGVRQMLIDNFGGVRMDGTNATIIGDKQGEFIADRNNITRVWMDHGVWPLLTTDLYIQQTGDIKILLEENTYFKDLQVCRGEDKDFEWSLLEGKELKDNKGNIYYGTILEHLLVQHLTSFYDVGEHNHIKLRGADWNDALDLAAQKGESVAFTAMYAKNMEQIASLLHTLKEQQVGQIMVEKGILMLLSDDEDLYNDVVKKNQLLHNYCMYCHHNISGNKVPILINELEKNLISKALWIKKHIQENEWVVSADGHGWYNGYYDNHGRMVEGETTSGVRMMLTSQVFTIMSETATDEQVKKIVNSADEYLFDAKVGGYRLNTDFHEIKMDLGRMFGFAYGHKENGAVFSHMTTMYGNALYERKAAKQANKVLSTLFEHCNNFDRSKIYPGVPEYIDEKGRGMYHYLTGAASWLLVTVITKMFGIHGQMGNLVFEPQLTKEQFDEKKEASLVFVFAGKQLEIVLKNNMDLEVGEYEINNILIDENPYIYFGQTPCIKREDILKLSDNKKHKIVIELVKKEE